MRDPIVRPGEYAAFRELALKNPDGQLERPLADKLQISSHEAKYILWKIKSNTPEGQKSTYCSVKLLRALRIVDSRIHNGLVNLSENIGKWMQQLDEKTRAAFMSEMQITDMKEFDITTVDLHRLSDFVVKHDCRIPDETFIGSNVGVKSISTFVQACCEMGIDFIRTEIPISQLQGNIEDSFAIAAVAMKRAGYSAGDTAKLLKFEALPLVREVYNAAQVDGGPEERGLPKHAFNEAVRLLTARGLTKDLARTVLRPPAP